jgi:hypothetical protein
MKIAHILSHKQQFKKCNPMGAGHVTQVVEHLPSKHQGLSSNHSTAKKK